MWGGMKGEKMSLYLQISLKIRHPAPTPISLKVLKHSYQRQLQGVGVTVPPVP